MNPFYYQQATSAEDAVGAAQDPGVRFLAGGTNLVDLMKSGAESPGALVDITRLPLGRVEPTPADGLFIEANVSNTAVANHPLVRTRYPLVSQAILSGASAQLRNMATTGGNLVQRTRCPYFADPAFTACNKRTPGSGCAALRGVHRNHAIFGASEHCVATFPSDMAVALAAYEAVIHTQGQSSRRAIPIGEFHRLPGDTPHIENVLAPGELIVGVELPPTPFGQNVWYLKVRDRHSYAFALVSVAAALELDGPRVRSAAVALGGVAHKPWRSPEAEAVLTGAAVGPEAFSRAAAAAVRDATPLEQNAFKVPLTANSIVRALTLAAAGGKS